MTANQAAALEWIRRILDEHRRGSRAQMFELLPWPVLWKRVTWTGGVGSWKMMRGGRLRIQVAASCSGFKKARSAAWISGAGSLVIRSKKGRQIGYRYAWCVEIRPDLLEFRKNDYLCGAARE